jgi:hypothetical protein
MRINIHRPLEAIVTIYNLLSLSYFSVGRSVSQSVSQSVRLGIEPLRDS